MDKYQQLIHEWRDFFHDYPDGVYSEEAVLEVMEAFEELHGEYQEAIHYKERALALGKIVKRFRRLGRHYHSEETFRHNAGLQPGMLPTREVVRLIFKLVNNGTFRELED